MAAVAERVVREKAAGVRRSQAAASLVAALNSKGVPIPVSLESALSGNGHGVDAAALQAGFALLYEPKSSTAGERASLAKKLKGDEEVESFESWLNRLPAAHEDKRVTQIDAGIFELRTLGDIPGAGKAESLLATARQSAGSDLLLDSLLLEMAQLLHAARGRAAAGQDFRVAAAELRAGGVEIGAFETRAATASTAQLIELTNEMRAALRGHQSKLAAAARRRVVLEGLAGLGYEVNEGLETAWVDQGRVIVRSATRPQYGVELQGDLNSERAQVRAVALVDSNAGPDPAQDKDAEAIWCSEVSRLQDHLAQFGDQFLIEKALEAGATPLKRIERSGTADQRSTHRLPQSKARHLS
ncbi:MAG: hypothetical protein GC155_09795 [Alphaproteobacteria bacterium]|nr:hypothetical protein [Alphaproteobacteria bacterium]